MFLIKKIQGRSQHEDWEIPRRLKYFIHYNLQWYYSQLIKPIRQLNKHISDQKHIIHLLANIIRWDKLILIFSQRLYEWIPFNKLLIMSYFNSIRNWFFYNLFMNSLILFCLGGCPRNTILICSSRNILFLNPHNLI